MTQFLALIAFLLPTYLIRFEIAGIPSTLLEALIWVTFVIGFIEVISGRFRRTADTPQGSYGTPGEVGRPRTSLEWLQSRSIWLVPAGLMLFGAIGGLLIAPDLRVALGLYKGFILDPILVYVLALAFVKTTDDAAVVARGLFLGAAGVAIWSLLDAGGSDPGGRVIGLYAFDQSASPNYLAFALAPLLPLAAWVGSRRELPADGGMKEAAQDRHGHQGDLVMTNWAWLLLIVMAAIAMILALHASDSRAGLVAGIGGLVIALILSGRLLTTHYSLLTQGLVVGLLVIAALSWFAVRPNFALTPQEGGRITASTNVRWQLWSATGEVVQQHWLLGAGLGGFQQQFGELTRDRVNYPEFITPRARTPHNLVIGIWMETGLIGLIGLLVALVLVGKTLFRALRSDGNTPPLGGVREERGQRARSMAVALLGSWFVLLAHGLVDQPIWKNDTMVLFWLLVTLSSVLTQKQESTLSS